jgi:outer membrane receptor for monomeric catechols
MVQNTRVGIAPSLAFGLGTENRATLSYYFIKSNDEPDSGIPFNNRLAENPIKPNKVFTMDGKIATLINVKTILAPLS